MPGGSIIRRGCYVAPGVICMPPMLINIGSHVGTGTTVDSHALVGSCAQVGERVHLSAGAQLGGVLEPANAAPVVIEDDVFIGGNCGIYEGTVVRRRAVLATGVILTRGTPVYDLARETVHRAAAGMPLEIPEGAVVVPGARPISSGWGAAQQLVAADADHREVSRRDTPTPRSRSSRGCDEAAERRGRSDSGASADRSRVRSTQSGAFVRGWSTSAGRSRDGACARTSTWRREARRARSTMPTLVIVAVPVQAIAEVAAVADPWRAGGRD